MGSLRGSHRHSVSSVGSILAHEAETGACDIKRMDNTEGEKQEPEKTLSRAERILATGFFKELKETWHLAWAIVLTGFFYIGMQPVATIFGGHLGKVELDAVAISNTLINVFGQSMVTGLVSGCDTLISQTYGSNNKMLVGLQLQQSTICIMLFLFPCFALHINIEALLLSIGYDPRVAELSGQYMLYFIPGMFFLFGYAIVQRYAQCQNVVIPHVIIGFTGILVHALCQYLFLYQFKWGIPGSAFAQVVGFFVLCMSTVLYIIISKLYKETWPGFDRRCLLGWGNFMKLAFPGMLMTCLEWWAFEICTLIAGTLGTTELGAQSIAFNIDAIFYALPFGIGVATTIRVGQYLGSNRPEPAKTAAKVGYCVLGVTSVAAAVLFALLRFELPKLFTSAPDVIDLASKILPIVALYTVFDNIATMGRAVLKGIGKQTVGALLIFIGYYCVALPIGISLMLVTYLQILGLWLGLALALFITAITFTTYIYCFCDWTKLAEQAQERAGVLYKPDETTALLDDEKEGSFINSYSNGDMRLSCKDDVETWVAKPQFVVDSLESVTPNIILKRILTLLCCVLILCIGIVCRLLIPLPNVDNSTFLSNGTDVTNSTIISLDRPTFFTRSDIS